MALNVTKTNAEKNFGDLDKQDSLKVVELDWGQDVLSFPTPYDYIIGADIVYIEDTFGDSTEDFGWSK